MSSVNIGTFKRKMGYYMKRVRAGGEVTLADRDTPVARIVPYKKGEPDCVVLPPKLRFSNMGDVVIPVLKTKIDSLSILKNLRSDR